jgi:hypothetical protein
MRHKIGYLIQQLVHYIKPIFNICQFYQAQIAVQKV